MVGNGAHLLLPVIDGGVGVVVVVKKRGNITTCNTSVMFAMC